MVEVNRDLLVNWGTRIFLYIFLFLLILFLSPIVVNISGSNIPSDNSLYAISSLIQGEASIFALVITLTIIAVQQASLYSPRIIDIFKFRNPDLWIVLVSYILIMVYGIRVLLQINTKYVPLFDVSFLRGLPITLNPILLTYYYGIFAFTALLFYTWYTIDLLRPIRIIRILSEKITINNILSRKDPIQPIIDIISYFMIDKHDNEITKSGLKIIEERIILLFANASFTYLKFENIKNENLLSVIQKTGKDEYQIMKSIKGEYEILDSIFKNENDQNKKDEKILDSYNYWKKILNDKHGSTEKLYTFLEETDDNLKNIKNEFFLMFKEYETLNQIYLQLQNLGISAIKEENYEIIEEVTNSLKNIGITAAEHDLKYPIRCTISSLEKIGSSAVNQKMTYSISHIIKLFDEMQLEVYFLNTIPQYSYPLITESTDNIYSKLKLVDLKDFAKVLREEQSNRVIEEWAHDLMKKQEEYEKD